MPRNGGHPQINSYLSHRISPGLSTSSTCISKLGVSLACYTGNSTTMLAQVPYYISFIRPHLRDFYIVARARAQKCFGHAHSVTPPSNYRSSFLSKKATVACFSTILAQKYKEEHKRRSSRPSFKKFSIGILNLAARGAS